MRFRAEQSSLSRLALIKVIVENDYGDPLRQASESRGGHARRKCGRRACSQHHQRARNRNGPQIGRSSTEFAFDTAAAAQPRVKPTRRRATEQSFRLIMTVVILGCGYTGEHVARRMIDTVARHLHVAGCRPVWPISRAPSLSPGYYQAVFARFRSFGKPRAPLDSSAGNERSGAIVTAWAIGRNDWSICPRRVSTAIERDVSVVESRAAARAALAEAASGRGCPVTPESSIVLRPAAIYGPGRGVHVSIAEGRYRLVGDGRISYRGFTSRTWRSTSSGLC